MATVANRYIPVPIPSSVSNRLWGMLGASSSAGGPGAYTPGQTNLVASAREWLNVPKCLMIAVVAVGVREYLKPPAVRINTAVTMKCQEKYCPPTYQVHVDAPKNTLLKDQSSGAGLGKGSVKGGIKVPYELTKREYMRAVEQSPGVNLVAKCLGHAIGAYV